MEATEVVQKGNLFKAKVIITNSTNYATKTTPEFLINCGVAVFQLRVVAAYISNCYLNLVFVRFNKRRSTDELTYLIHFNSPELNITDKKFTSDDGTWHLIHENKKQQFSFKVAVEMQLIPSVSSFASLHEDTELTDFELRGEDGSVRMHRAVLAAASPVLRRMLAGAWRETSEGHVDVIGTSKATLEHLKNYMYVHTLPDVGLEQLLLLSSYYMMPDLERRCVARLVRTATAQNIIDLVEFAAKHNLKRLLFAILECVHSDAINFDEMHVHFTETVRE